MYWPRFRLTKSEAKRWCIYSSPDSKLKAAVYRIYAGELQLSTTNKEDTENMQISRRSRVFGFTASGDVNNIEIQIYDSAGEQYTMNFIPVSNLLLGSNPDFRGVPLIDGPANAIEGSLGFFPYSLIYGDTQAPHIFQPNIVLDPNQTLSIKGRCMHALTDSTFSVNTGITLSQTATLSFNIHVWEFPLE